MKRINNGFLILGMALLLGGCSSSGKLTIEDEANKDIEIVFGEAFNYDPKSLGIHAEKMDEIVYNTIDLNQLGKQQIEYVYEDEKLVVTVRIVDKKAPVLDIEEITIPFDELELWHDYLQVSAIDDYEGDLSQQVVCDELDVLSVSGPMDVSLACRVEDSSGNKSEGSLLIHVVESSEENTSGEVIQVYESGIVNGLSVVPHIVEDPYSIYVMVNKFNALPDDFAPYDLVDIGGGYLLRQEAAVQYAAMKDQADREGIPLIVLSAYRTKNYQEGLFWNYVNNEGEEFAATFSAVPRRSEHELGLAIDVGDNYYLDENLDQSATGIWLNENAANYGFILRFPEDKVLTTQYGFEAWHYRYVGSELALKLKESNLTLEEFYQLEGSYDSNSYRFY